MLHAGYTPGLCGPDVFVVHLINEGDAVPIQCELEADVVINIVGDPFEMGLEGHSRRASRPGPSQSVAVLPLRWVHQRRSSLGPQAT